MKTHRTKKAFTLLELLTVMAIMALLTTLATTGYFAAIRGISKGRGAAGFVNALTLARQRACTDGVRTSVVCFNIWSGAENTEGRKAATPSYVICTALGRFTYVNGNLLGDEFTPLDRMFNLPDYQKTESLYPIRLYNLTRGQWIDVKQEVSREFYRSDNFRYPDRPDVNTGVTPRVLLQFTAKSSVGWQVGDAYGVAVSAVSALPKGVYFGSPLAPSGNTDVPPVIFEFYPDGQAKEKNIDLTMVNKSDAEPEKFKKITVKTTGEITSSDK